MKKQLKNFFTFIRRQGVVGLAIGFVLGGATSAVVSSLVEDILNPFIGLILGGTESLEQMVFTIGSAQIRWGNFFSTLIDFFVIAAVVYFVFKGLGLEKIDKKKNT